MIRRLGTRACLVAIAACVLLPTADLSAQVPPGTPEQLERGLRVTASMVTPDPIQLTRGDTILLTVAMIDSAGARVRGTQFGIARRTSRFMVRSIKDTIADSYRLWAAEPGESMFEISVQVPRDSAGVRLDGLEWKLIDSAVVTVSDWPIARVAIAEPDYRPYAGTSFQLHATVMTDHDTEHFAATVAWRSENPSVATITPGGVVFLAKPGNVRLVATTDGGISSEHRLRVVENPVRQLDISPKYVETRTGDVVHFDIKPLDSRGRLVEGIVLTYGVHGLDSAGADIYEDGAFVAENPGTYKVVVSGGGLAEEAVVNAARRERPSPVELVGRGATPHVTTSDLWVFEGNDGRDYAYTGTHAEGGGNRMYVWDVTDPDNVTLTDSLVVDGRVVNDVKVSGDASWAIITREGASTRRNGIVVLDLRNPAHPTILSELTDSLTAGIHNVWINGDVVYAVNDGTNAMNIIDLSDPANPTHAGRWEIRPGQEDKSLHDIWADGRYAYLSYWDDGLVILDIGAGTHGGTPTEPKFVSSISYAMGNTHTAYREGNYVYLGDEIMMTQDFSGPLSPRGYIHVIDVSDIDNPTEVAKFEVPEAGTHNIWVENGVLYIGYYQGGLRVVDVSGELRGDLYRQGREIGWFETAADAEGGIHPNATMAWGPQLFKGNVFVSDMNSGLWVVRHQRPTALSP